MLYNARLMYDYMIVPRTLFQGSELNFLWKDQKDSRNPRMQSIAQLGTDSFLKVSQIFKVYRVSNIRGQVVNKTINFLNVIGFYTSIHRGKTNKSFTQLKQTPKFTSVYFTWTVASFRHFSRKTGTILFLMNVKNNNLRTTSIQTIKQTNFLTFTNIKF